MFEGRMRLLPFYFPTSTLFGLLENAQMILII